MGMLFQMICLTNLLLQKGARDRSFCRLAVAVHILQLKPELLRQSFLMFITCGHYASVTIDNNKTKKLSSNYLSYLMTGKNR